VAIPTRNGGTRVVEALGSVVGQLQAEDELFVVDNGSDDDTAGLVTNWFASVYPNGRLLRLDRAGLNMARNAALRAARSEVVCFLDDDEFAGDQWLGGLRAAWRDLGPRVGAIGGPMRPLWPHERPPWLHDDILHALSILDLGSVRRRLAQQPFTGYVWGGNMSVRVAAALEVGGFDPQLGYGTGQVLIASRGDEEELQDRLAQAGWEIWYEPSAWIDHRLPPERLSPAFFRRTYRRAALLDLQAGKGRAGGALSLLKAVARLPRALLRPNRGELVLGSFEVTYGLARLFGEPSSTAG
jgi:glycosyltransferase involved in cell wall biosynthesis